MKSPAESFPRVEGKRLSMDFDKPPVIETSLGFIFNKIVGWNVLHFGALWEHFKNKYPHTEFPPPIIATPPAPPLTVQWSPSESIIPLRALFTDASRSQLVQVQNEFFLHNWRKTDETPDYEHYDRILPLFREDWSVYLAFLAERKLARPTIIRSEMSYFNHIVRGQDFETYEDLPKVFRNWRGFEKNPVFNGLEFVAFHIVQPVGVGKIQIVVSPGVRTADGKEILQVNLTASVVPSGSADDSIFLALSECHQIALRSFDGFFTDEMLSKWGRKK